jgi:hypothetical protein
VLSQSTRIPFAAASSIKVSIARNAAHYVASHAPDSRDPGHVSPSGFCKQIHAVPIFTCPFADIPLMS